jgi:flagellar protein FlaG
MDGMINTLHQARSQMVDNGQDSASTVNTKVQEAPKVNLVKEAQDSLAKNDKNSGGINSAEQVEQLVNELNKALAPINTDIKFGVDSNDTFYVAVNDANTGRMIRRFPAEEAETLLPKMQDVSGALLDTKS